MADTELKPWQLPAGEEIDRLVDKMFGVPSPKNYRNGRRTKNRWSTEIRDTYHLLDLVSGMANWRVSLIKCVDESARASGDWWTCHIEPLSRYEDWYCEAAANTLQLAFCRAFLQEKEED